MVEVNQQRQYRARHLAWTLSAALLTFSGVAVLPTAASAVIVSTTASRIVTVSSDLAGVIGVIADWGVQPTNTYTSLLTGFAAELSDEQVAALRSDPRVVNIENDAPVSTEVSDDQAGDAVPGR